MKELSLHILDIAENGIRAKATQIKITIVENLKTDRLHITIEDNGYGMEEDFLDKVLDPFTTTRTTRRVGLGLPFFKRAAEECNGQMRISSNPGQGTIVEATFQHSHIDRVPLGNMAETLTTLILANDSIDYIYEHFYNENKFFFSTIEIKKRLQDISISEVEVVLWIKEYIEEGLKELVKN
ncbi:ATP-binding protein [Alkaliphilus crotonatoxidans]